SGPDGSQEPYEVSCGGFLSVSGNARGVELVTGDEDGLCPASGQARLPIGKVVARQQERKIARPDRQGIASVELLEDRQGWQKAQPEAVHQACRRARSGVYGQDGPRDRCQLRGTGDEQTPS